ncbi:hypothetical protein BU14_0345s0010 [Porphyra umbilicalis]|uniref:Uncharacterized protein n=1 Tax=Porphyra umbilicalis TaxID=2786 RepID=A0A1X6NY02_PORUM|nr:hypothetical protein BU14_0345s0010 [Porphyra umbilicalis]|eukprot:OSX73478.1 hypothetical protein BU14_0345s0010 [Porphyra umbilicalis]
MVYGTTWAGAPSRRQRRPLRRGRLGVVALAAAVGGYLASATSTAADCPAVVNVTSLYARTVLRVSTKLNSGSTFALQNVWGANSATPLRVAAGMTVELSVRDDPTCPDDPPGSWPTRHGVAAAIYLRRTDGTTTAILTDRSWSWRGGSTVGRQLLPTDLWAAPAGFVDADSRTPEGADVPRGAAWLTHPRSGAGSSTVWRHAVKVMPATVCDGVDADAPPPVRDGGAGVGVAVDAAPPRSSGGDGRWATAPTVASSVLGSLLAATTAAAVVSALTLRRERRRGVAEADGGGWTKGALPATAWELPSPARHRSSVDGSGWGGGGGGGEAELAGWGGGGGGATA